VDATGRPERRPPGSPPRPLLFQWAADGWSVSVYRRRRISRRRRPRVCVAKPQLSHSLGRRVGLAHLPLDVANTARLWLGLLCLVLCPLDLNSFAQWRRCECGSWRITTSARCMFLAASRRPTTGGPRPRLCAVRVDRRMPFGTCSPGESAVDQVVHSPAHAERCTAAVVFGSITSSPALRAPPRVWTHATNHVIDGAPVPMSGLASPDRAKTELLGQYRNCACVTITGLVP